MIGQTHLITPFTPCMLPIPVISMSEHSFDLRDKVKNLISYSLEAQDRNGETSTGSNAVITPAPPNGSVSFNTPVRGGSCHPSTFPNAAKSSAAPEAERGDERASGSSRKPWRKNRGGKKRVPSSQSSPTAAKTASASIDYSAEGVSTSGGGSGGFGGGSSGSTRGQRGGRRRARGSRRKGPVTGATSSASPRSPMSVTPSSQSQKPYANSQKQQQQKRLGKGGTSKTQGAMERRNSLTNRDETNLNKGFVSREVVKALLEPSGELVWWDDRARDFLILLLQVWHGDGGRRGGALVVCALCPGGVCGGCDKPAMSVWR